MIYPQKLTSKKSNELVNMLIISSIMIGVVMFIINKITSPTIPWSAIANAGLIYVCEALSVIIQVTYFKKTGGKRVFRMAPIHHHFELGGWHETKVVRVFCLFTLVCCIIAVISVM